MFPSRPPESAASPKPPFGYARLCLVLFAALGLADPSFGAGDYGVSASTLKELTLEQLLNVEVISVSKRPERLVEAPSAIQVLRNEEIMRSGALTVPEALRLAPNLQVAQRAPHDWGISARGFNSARANKLLVMIDGRTVYTPLFSGIFWDVQDYLLEDIDRIEVVSGPGATLWGANAVNGVINIMSKSARDTQGLYTEAGVGSETREFGAVRYGVPIGARAHLRVYGKAFTRDNAVLANGASAKDSAILRSGGFRLDAETASASTLTVQGDGYRGSEYIATGGNRRMSGGNLLGRWSRGWGHAGDLVVQVYFDHTHRIDPITNPFGTAQYLRDDLDTYDFDLQHRILVGLRQEIVWGLGYRLTHDEMKNAPNIAIFPARAEMDLFNVFVQDEITLTAKLFLTIGTKIEHNDYTGREFEPSVRLAWRVSPEHTVWGAISRAVRMPSRADQGVVQPGVAPYALSGSMDFRSEVLIAYEAGYRAQISHNLTASVAAFYHDYDRLRSLDPLPGRLTPPLTFGNNLTARTHGLECSAQYQVRSGWRLRAGYNYLSERVRVKPGHTDFFGGRNEVSDPKHQVVFGSSWNLPRGMTADANFRWVDTLPTTGAPVPSYAEADARLAWSPNERWEFSVVGQNLLHARHPEYGVGSPLREEIQRSVYGKISLRF